MKVLERVITLPTYDGEFRLIPFGCLHADDPGHRKALWDQCKAELLKPNTYGIGAGDYRDLLRTTAMNYLAGYRADKISRQNLDALVRESTIDFYHEYFKGLESKIIGLCKGNHLFEYCLEDSVEALTPSGWKVNTDLSLGENILAFDPITNTISWQPLQAIHRFEHDGPAVSTAVGVCTYGHKWWGRTNIQNAPHQMVCTEGQLLKCFHVPITGTPQKVVQESELDWFVQLMGWIMTDGTLVKCRTKPSLNNRVRVFQKPGAKTEMIRDMFARSGYRVCYHIRADGIGVFEFGGALSDRARSVFDEGKRFSYKWLATLTPRQVRLLYDTCILGDGCMNDIAQKDRARLEPLMAALIWSGLPARLNVRKVGPSLLCPKGPIDMWFLTLKERHETWLQAKPLAHHHGIMWCPTVASGYWVARKRGKVFVTGNSDGTNDNQQLCQLLNVPYLTNPSFIRLVIKTPTGKTRHILRLLIHHGHWGGGSSRPGGSLNAMEMKSAGFDCDIYVFSHDHRKLAMHIPTLTISRTGRLEVIERPRCFIRTGCFVAGYDEKCGDGNYVQDKLMHPSDLGYVILTVKCYREYDAKAYERNKRRHPGEHELGGRSGRDKYRFKVEF